MEGNEITIQIKDDRLFKYCSYCGIISHEVSSCEKKVADLYVESQKMNVFSRVDISPKPAQKNESLLRDDTKNDHDFANSWRTRLLDKKVDDGGYLYARSDHHSRLHRSFCSSHENRRSTVISQVRDNRSYKPYSNGLKEDRRLFWRTQYESRSGSQY